MQSDTGDDVVGLLAALSQDPANEKLITSVSRNASSAVFCQEFAAKGLPLLFHSLQVRERKRGKKKKKKKKKTFFFPFFK